MFAVDGLELCDLAAAEPCDRMWFMHIPKNGGTTIAKALPGSWQRAFYPQQVDDVCGKRLGWSHVRRAHLTPDELVRCGVVNTTFFHNRTVICTVRDPIARLASAANYHHVSVSKFLSACDHSHPRLDHNFWAHCRPQSDFFPFCQRLIPMEDIDDVLAPELSVHGIDLHGTHKNAGRVTSNGTSATDHTIWRMDALEMNRALRRYTCDFKLAALGWPLGRTCSEAGGISHPLISA